MDPLRAGPQVSGRVMIATIIIIWFAVSFPTALVVGRYLRGRQP